MRKEIKTWEKKRRSAKDFIVATKKYTDLTELDAVVLRGFIERIFVSKKNKATKAQKLEVVHDFVSAFDFKAARKRSENSKHTGNLDAA
jgi:hypothetical protein